MPFVIVSAMSGAMGGSASEEFLAPIPSGEDTFVRCQNCGYAANVEAVRISPPAERPSDGLPPAVVHDTPGTPTIATLVDHLNGRGDLEREDSSSVDSGRHVEERRRDDPAPGRDPSTTGDRCAG